MPWQQKQKYTINYINETTNMFMCQMTSKLAEREISTLRVGLRHSSSRPSTYKDMFGRTKPNCFAKE